jgi:hypothetical protein
LSLILIISIFTSVCTLSKSPLITAELPSQLYSPKLSFQFLHNLHVMAGTAMKGGNFAHNNTIASKQDKVLPLFSNKGKTAIVSGAGAGIGLAVAQALAESGANVAIWYNSNKKAVERAADIEKEYGVKCKCS